MFIKTHYSILGVIVIVVAFSGCVHHGMTIPAPEKSVQFIQLPATKLRSPYYVVCGNSLYPCYSKKLSKETKHAAQ